METKEIRHCNDGMAGGPEQFVRIKKGSPLWRKAAMKISEAQLEHTVLFVVSANENVCCAEAAGVISAEGSVDDFTIYPAEPVEIE